MSTEARRGIGPAWVGIALGAIVALAFVASALLDRTATTTSLALGPIWLHDVSDGARVAGFNVSNSGSDDIKVLEATVSGVPAAKLVTDSVLVASFDSASIPIRFPCPSSPRFEKLVLRLLVDGREATQTLQTAARVEICS
ncbi:hypothetical protein OJ998_22720 [Solirubrobacter taibaiensis]|nr:hypothetical protein [Solirubrobacter taibaiensis]